jgi:hypothetical protein
VAGRFEKERIDVVDEDSQQVASGQTGVVVTEIAPDREQERFPRA